MNNKIPKWLEIMILTAFVGCVMLLFIKWYDNMRKFKVSNTSPPPTLMKLTPDEERNVLSLTNRAAVQLGSMMFVPLTEGEWQVLSNEYSKAVTNLNLIFKKSL